MMSFESAGIPIAKSDTGQFGSSHSACACTKPIPCLVVFAALFSGSNSNSTTPWYRNYTPAEAPATTPALIPDVGRAR
jgi:hypothetical protein